MKVLFLSAWYPTERDAMAGLFVKKHAEAVAQQGHDVRVLFSEKTGLSWARDMYKSWKRLKKDWGKPDIVQMNVLDKNGLIALWLKQRYHIPYTIIEHWSGYLPANFAFRGGWHGWIMRKIAQEASCILPVSQMLEDAMKNCGITNTHWQRIHNVVDDFFYQPITPITITPKGNKFRFLHVSCFDEKAKNIQGILRGARKIANERQDFELVIIGTGVDYKMDVDYAKSLNFPEGIVHFIGEQTPLQVAEWMQQSDAFVLFSRFETFAIVLAEAMAVGIPIICSKTAGIAEYLPTECGVVVEVDDDVSFTEALREMVAHHNKYSPEQIRKHGQQYTYRNVGKKLMEIYNSVL
jgi:glycosyltransferase involved in cell wall biosynthesis